jgi:hypothetical protein
MVAEISEVLTVSITSLMMDASSTSETSVNLYETTWHNIPEDSHLLFQSIIAYLLCASLDVRNVMRCTAIHCPAVGIRASLLLIPGGKTFLSSMLFPSVIKESTLCS